MAGMVTANEISGASVYGVTQYDFTVEGVAGYDFAGALTAAAFKEATAIEQAAQAYTSIVKLRQKKVTDLAQVLAVLAEAIANMDPKSNDTSKTGSASGMTMAASICSSYGLSLNNSGSSITYKNATKSQNNVQYEMDKTDNDLQQDIVALNSMMSRRDNSFSTAARIVRKSFNSMQTTLRNIAS